MESTTLEEILDATLTESGATLRSLTDASPVMLVFLRHFGCTFCRETIANVAGLKTEFDARGVHPVFVHLGTPAIAQAHFEYYGLPGVERVHDPEAKVYRHEAFGLGRTHPASHFFKPGALRGWFGRGAFLKHGFGMIQGDGSQMPGVFVLEGARIMKRFVHRSIADRPDYLKLIS